MVNIFETIRPVHLTLTLTLTLTLILALALALNLTLTLTRQSRIGLDRDRRLMKPNVEHSEVNGPAMWSTKLLTRS